VLAVEASVFAGLEFVFEFQMRPVDVGWLLPPLIAGCVGWVVFPRIWQPSSPPSGRG
jgi:hypothetical protein